MLLSRTFFCAFVVDVDSVSVSATTAEALMTEPRSEVSSADESTDDLIFYTKIATSR